MQHLMRRDHHRGIWLRAVANVTALAGISGAAAAGYLAAVAVKGMYGEDAAQAPAHVRDGGNRTVPSRSRSVTNTPIGDEDAATEESGGSSGLAPALPHKTANAPPTNAQSSPNTAVQGGSNGS